MLENGSKVIVRFSRNNVFEFQNYALQIECTLLHSPCGEGDHFHFEYNGIKFTVNPLASDFVGVVAVKHSVHPTLLEPPQNERIYSDNPNDDEGDK